MSELIERLREGVHGKSVTLTDGLLNSRLHEAADQLEAQQAEIARLREVLGSVPVSAMVGKMGWKSYDLALAGMAAALE